MIRRLLSACLAIGLLLLGPCASALAATEEAVLAGGGFWCLEPVLEDLPGGSGADRGSSGGRLDNPCYGQVSSGGTGHQEVVRVRFDPQTISYPTLLPGDAEG